MYGSLCTIIYMYSYSMVFIYFLTYHTLDNIHLLEWWYQQILNSLSQNGSAHNTPYTTHLTGIVTTWYYASSQYNFGPYTEDHTHYYSIAGHHHIPHHWNKVEHMSPMFPHQPLDNLHKIEVSSYIMERSRNEEKQQKPYLGIEPQTSGLR